MNPILTNAGRAAIAASIQAKTLFLAWGQGDSNWSTTNTVQGTVISRFPASTNQFATGHTNIASAFVKLTSSGVNFQEGRDFTVNQATGVFTRTTGGTMQNGDNVTIGWHVRPAPPSLAAGGLMAEVGRRKVLNKQFVTPDPNGAILVRTGRFTIVPQATPHLFCSVTFEPNEAPDKNIREIGLFQDTVTQTGLPAGQMYFTPAQVTTPGLLLVLDNIVTVERSPVAYETFNFVITI